MPENSDIQLKAYRRAQLAMAELKSAALEILAAAGDEGLKNSQVGRLLGIYQGHVGHEGHISRTVLQMLQVDGVVAQDGPDKRWRLRELTTINNADESGE